MTVTKTFRETIWDRCLEIKHLDLKWHTPALHLVDVFFWFWIRKRKPVSIRHPSCMQCVWLTTRLRNPNWSKGSTRPEPWLIVDYANRSTSEWISFALILFVCLCLPSLLFPLLQKLLLFVYRSCVISLSPPNTPAAWSLHYSFYLWLGILLKK